MKEIENDTKTVSNLPRLSESPSKLPRHNAFDVKDEMSIFVKKLSVENFAMLPETIWNIAKDKMNTTYGTSWCGLKREAVKNLVSRMQTDQNCGSLFNKIENTSLHFMKDTG